MSLRSVSTQKATKASGCFGLRCPASAKFARGEVTVNTTLAEEELSIEVQKATALEKVKVLAEIVVKAATRPADAHGT